MQLRRPVFNQFHIVLLLFLHFFIPTIAESPQNDPRQQQHTVTDPPLSPNNSTRKNPPTTTAAASIALPQVSVSVECKEPLLGSASWECAIEEEEEDWSSKASGEGGHPPVDGAWEELEGKGEKSSFRAGHMEMYHSNKVNRTTGLPFISAIVRWQFDSQLFHSLYTVHLRIQELSLIVNGTDHSSPPSPVRLFTIPLAPIGNGSSMGGRNQRVELFVRLDGLFQFGRSYHLRVISSLPHPNGGGRGGGGGDDDKKSRALAVAEKQIQFAALPDEFDTEGCREEDGKHPNGRTAPSELGRRQEMASRWSGALRSVAFFPLHSAINATFFGAPPSHCIPGYKIQLWLMNELQAEKMVNSDQLVREGVGIFVGSVEFRDMLKVADERLKYRLKIMPIEYLPDGTCVCKLAGKCECVLVYSDPFSMPNAVNVDEPRSIQNSPPSLADSSARSTILPILLACLFLALTLIFLSFALFLLILRNANRADRKRRTLLVFSRKGQKSGEELGGLVIGGGSRKSQNRNGNDGAGSRREVQSVLLLNAQPQKRGELERFARLLVKNGIRVFYDRWDRASIEQNMLLWVHQAATKADKIVLFWDRRAEQLLIPSERAKVEQQMDAGEDIFDRTFCALHQQLDAQKTIFVKWDDQLDPTEGGRPLGSISENVFLFKRDLKLIYSALKVPVTDSELREIENRFGQHSSHQIRPHSLMVIVPKLAKKNSEQTERLLVDEGRGSSEEETLLGAENGEKERRDGDICTVEFVGEQISDAEENGLSKNSRDPGEPLDSGIASDLHDAL